MRICEYGCGREAIHQFKNGKWCCSINYHSCPESKRNNSDKHKGIKISIETKNKISKKLKGRKHTEDTKRKIGFANKKENLSEQTLIKLSNIRKGKKHTEGTKRKISNSNKGKLPWNTGLIGTYKHTTETKRKISISNKGRQVSINNKKATSLKNKLTISKIEFRYPIFFKIEKMRYHPDKPEKKEIQVKCKNHNCNNSIGWFTPTGQQLSDRIMSIERIGNDGSYFYCSDKCKHKCPLYGKSAQQIIKQDKIKAGYIKEEYYTESERQIFNKEVLKRANNLCEYCGEKATHVHHIRPQKLEPFFSLDPDFGLACCSNCHYKKGHKDECSTGQLAATVCK